MAVIKSFLMRNKDENGNFETLYPITSAKNVKTTEDIKVEVNNPLGSYVNDEIIPAGTNLNTFIKKIVKERIAPVYIFPKVTLSVIDGDDEGLYEVGSAVHTSLNSNIDIGDAGGITTHTILRQNDEVLATDISSEISKDVEIFMGTDIIEFKSVIKYSAGPIKNDNFGDPYPSTSIKSGTTESNVIKFTPYRKFFYTTDDLNSAPTASNEIREFTHSLIPAEEGTTITLTIPVGGRRAVVAYPSDIRDVDSIKYVEFNHDESKSFFNRTMVNVEGANNYGEIEYKVFTFILDQPAPTKMTFDITI